MMKFENETIRLLSQKSSKLRAQSRLSTPHRSSAPDDGRPGALGAAVRRVFSSISDRALRPRVCDMRESEKLRPALSCVRAGGGRRGARLVDGRAARGCDPQVALCGAKLSTRGRGAKKSGHRAKKANPEVFQAGSYLLADRHLA